MKQLNISAKINALEFIENDKSIAEIYETLEGAKSKVNTALTEAKGYTDTVKGDLIGKSGDAAGANTLYGAKAYADDVAAAALEDAKQDAAGKYVLQTDTSYVQYDMNSAYEKKAIRASAVFTNKLVYTYTDEGGGESPAEIDVSILGEMANYDLAQGEF
jgi:hypothetical protein